MINLKTAHEIDLMARAGTLLASVLPPLRAKARGKALEQLEAFKRDETGSSI